MQSQAIIIEPIIGLGSTTYDVASGGADADIPTSLFTGLKVGTDIIDVGIGALYATVDYRMTSSKLESVPLVGDVDFDRTLLGLNVGVDLPLIRGWLAYYFQDNTDFDNSAFEKSEETSTGIGVSLGIIPFVEINIEYLTTPGDDFDLNTLIASVSVPLSI